MNHRIKTWIMKKLIIRQNRTRTLDIDYMEKYRLGPDVPKHYNNSFYFTAHRADGLAFLIRLAFRGDGTVETWFNVYVPGKGAYSYDNHLDVPTKDGTLSSGPISFKLLEPAKKWQLIFDGKVKSLSNNKLIKAKLKGFFLSDLPIYDFSKDAHPQALAEALAREKWSRSFFKELQNNKQVHYEQGGRFEGYLQIGKEKIELNIPAFRDHSFGPRDWNYMQRHVWLVGFLEDGSFFNYSLVRYPSVYNLTAGFLMTKDETLSVIGGIPLDKLYNGMQIPNMFEFECTLENGKHIEGSCFFDHSFSWILGNGVYQITEGLAQFEINGVPGRGIAEFGNNISEKTQGGK